MIMAKGKIRVLIGKPGLDGHDRGAKIIARALRDAGMEVVYTGLHRSPDEIVETAIQEDVDAIGLSILSGAHMTLFPRIMHLLKEQGADDILLFGGGIIPEEDRQALLDQGVSEIFVPGGATQRTIKFLKERFEEKLAKEQQASAT
jgi:methylmalonyl-CoA mutase C-terminal domain/subunit